MIHRKLKRGKESQSSFDESSSYTRFRCQRQQKKQTLFVVGVWLINLIIQSYLWALLFSRRTQRAYNWIKQNFHVWENGHMGWICLPLLSLCSEALQYATHKDLRDNTQDQRVGIIPCYCFLLWFFVQHQSNCTDILSTGKQLNFPPKKSQH